MANTIELIITLNIATERYLAGNTGEVLEAKKRFIGLHEPGAEQKTAERVFNSHIERIHLRPEECRQDMERGRKTVEWLHQDIVLTCDYLTTK